MFGFTWPVIWLRGRPLWSSPYAPRRAPALREDDILRTVPALDSVQDESVRYMIRKDGPGPDRELQRGNARRCSRAPPSSHGAPLALRVDIASAPAALVQVLSSVVSARAGSREFVLPQEKARNPPLEDHPHDGRRSSAGLQNWPRSPIPSRSLVREVAGRARIPRPASVLSNGEMNFPRRYVGGLKDISMKLKQRHSLASVCARGLRKRKQGGECASSASLRQSKARSQGGPTFCPMRRPIAVDTARCPNRSARRTDMGQGHRPPPARGRGYAPHCSSMEQAKGECYKMQGHGLPIYQGQRPSVPQLKGRRSARSEGLDDMRFTCEGDGSPGHREDKPRGLRGGRDDKGPASLRSPPDRRRRRNDSAQGRSERGAKKDAPEPRRNSRSSPSRYSSSAA